jgi:hypothetical protein
MSKLKKTPFVHTLAKYLHKQKTNIYNTDKLSELIRDLSIAICQPIDAQPEAYIEWLVENNQLYRLDILKKPHGAIERYAISIPTHMELGLSIRSGCYFSHLTAAYLHGLITWEPTLLCLSKEGTPGEAIQVVELEQESIDAAFAKEQRSSGIEYEWRGKTYLQVAARNTGMLGVEEKNGLLVTSIERTLIDLMVRPLYGGGAKIIAEIFKTAREQCSVESLISMFDAIPFIYPYHQSLGWYLSAAGYETRGINELRKRPMPYIFYVDYRMKNPKFSSAWNLYYPKDLS